MNDKPAAANQQLLETEDGNLQVSLADGQARVVLPFEVDLDALTELLTGDGYSVANDPAEADSQGWGPGEDTDNYHPYWVYRLGARGTWVFAVPPQDYTGEPGAREPMVGHRTVELLRRWYPRLQTCARGAAP